MELLESKVDAHRHPWELSRAESSLVVLKDYTTPAAKFVDVGAGDMYFARVLRMRTSHPIVAIDSNYPSDTAAACDDIQCYRDLTQLPKGYADCVLLMDVLEHVDRAVEFVTETIELLQADGFFYVTVPAHQYLVSEHDIFWKHFRRYSKRTLLKEFQQSNIAIVELFYFYTSVTEPPNPATTEHLKTGHSSNEATTSYRSAATGLVLPPDQGGDRRAA